jgi:hypothetical protein
MLNGADINLQQVRDGFAWVYEKYIGENTLDVQARYLSTEAEARQYRRGLWSDPHPIPPWSSEALDKFRREVIFRTSFVEGISIPPSARRDPKTNMRFICPMR